VRGPVAPSGYGVGVKIRYVLHTAYGAGGTIRTVINQANVLCADHDVEIASVYRTRERPAFAIDPRVRLVPLTNLHADGTRRADQPDHAPRLLARARRYKNPLPHKHDYPYKQWDPLVDAAILRYFWRQRDAILVTTRPALNLLSARFAPRRLIRVAQDHLNLGSYKPALRAAITEAYPRMDAVTVLTQHDRDDWLRALGDRPLRLACIPNGIPPWPHPPAALDAEVLVAAGRLGRQKGFDLLLDAFKIVNAEHPDWRLDIYGGGDWQDRLTRQIDELGLTGSAHLRGVSRHLDEVFTKASIYVLSSRKEGLPMVLLEAMAAGLPPVSFDCPTGPAEVIKNGVNGLLIPPEDPAALAAGINELIEDPDRRKQLGAGALESSGRYAMPVIRAAWEELFTELVATRAGARPDHRSGHR
jgi:glycosyltransferase involved in cell wall biosynthesis